MTGGTDRPQQAVVRAERFELVDGDGCVRAVLGALAAPGEDAADVVGIELRDRSGAARAWLTFEEGWGAQLCLAERGNQVLLLDVVDATPAAAEPGPSVRLCDPTGTPVLEWRVTGDGRVVQRPGPTA